MHWQECSIVYAAGVSTGICIALLVEMHALHKAFEEMVRKIEEEYQEKIEVEKSRKVQ